MRVFTSAFGKGDGCRAEARVWVVGRRDRNAVAFAPAVVTNHVTTSLPTWAENRT